MKITKPNLLKALDFPASIIKQRATIPILACVRLVASNNTFTVSACDCDQFCQATAECEGELLDICVSAKGINNILPVLSEEITITVKAEKLVFDFISDGKPASIALPTQSADDFPAWEFGQQKAIGLNCADLAECIKPVVWAAHKESTRGPLHAVHIRTGAKSIMAEAVNGRELARVETAAIAAESDFLMPLPFVSNLSKSLALDGAELSLSEKKCTVKWGDGLYSVKLSECSFPSTSAVLPPKRKKLGEITPAVWKPAFQTILGMDNERPYLNVSGGFIAHEGKGGVLNTPAPEKLTTCDLRLNAMAFLDCLNATKGETAVLSLCVENLAVVLQQGDLTVATMQLRS